MCYDSPDNGNLFETRKVLRNSLDLVNLPNLIVLFKGHLPEEHILDSDGGSYLK